MKITIDLDPPGDEARTVRFRGSGLHDNEHTQAVFDLIDQLTVAVRLCQDTEHKGGMHVTRPLATA